MSHRRQNSCRKPSCRQYRKLALELLEARMVLAAQFADVGDLGLDGVYYGALAWGDYDNDGDLDVLITGYQSGEPIARIYQNNNGTFSDISAGLTGVRDGSVAWGDYDSDGDLDLLVTGRDIDSNGIAQIYQNNGGAFIDISAGLIGVSHSSVAWGDYDNDGDLDILIAGRGSDRIGIARIYQNNGGTFTDILAGLPGVSYSSVAWGDYDNDGDLDILIAGEDNNARKIARIYQNTDGTFTDISAGLTGVGGNSAAWGDYDNDGDLDILLAGVDNPIAENDGNSLSRLQLYVDGITRIYQNNGGTFSDVSADVADVGFGTAAWGDYDNDGDLDILLMGPGPFFKYVARVYQNNGGEFSEIPVGLPHADGVAAWGDYDGDGDLDILHISRDPNRNYLAVARVFQNNGALANPPEASEFNDLGDLGLPGTYDASLAWGDYDNDGDLDVLFTGIINQNIYIARIYQNDNGKFNDISAGLVGVTHSAVAWGDYDNDGDLDILLTGKDGSNNPIARVYQNNGGAFNDISAGLTGVLRSSVDWGDYDNDGDLDILISGYDSFYGHNPITHIYQNNGGAFSNISAGLTGVAESSVDWGDYDNDGDLDVLLTGYGSNSAIIARIYQNTDGIFSDISAGLSGAGGGVAAWGDYDDDGDLDILIAGIGGNSLDGFTRVYQNNGGTFSDISAGLPNLRFGTAAWGDYDNDGDLDILITGATSDYTHLTRIYQNTGGAFHDISAGLDDVILVAAAWGDYDGDGDLDILHTRPDRNHFAYVTRIYQNNTVTVATPTELTGAVISAASVTFSSAAANVDVENLLAHTIGQNDDVAHVYGAAFGSFIDVSAGFFNANGGAAAPADDNSGAGDILPAVEGSSGDPHSHAYQDAAEISTALTSGNSDSVDWGRFDNTDELLAEIALAVAPRWRQFE